MSIIAFTGLDVHDATIRVFASHPETGEVLLDQTLVNDETVVKKQFRKWSKKYSLNCCYEASGSGYVLHRWLTSIGIPCTVIAASLVPQRSGDRLKTDRRDAIKLSRFFRNGDLTPVRVPTEQEEQDRRVVRYREALVRRVVRTKNQILKLLQTVGIKNPYKSTWTAQHLGWLKQLELPSGDGFVLSELLDMLRHETSRLIAVDQRVKEMAESELYRSRVSMVMCLRGFSYVSAMTLITEIVDFSRFKTPRELMCFLGLTPSEFSSGASRRLGGITKCGNTRCRHILVESAGHYRNKPRISWPLKKRQQDQDPEVIAHSWKAQERLYKKYWGIANRKEKGKAVVAVARELVGFIWAIMTGNLTQPAKPKSASRGEQKSVQGAFLTQAQHVRDALKVISNADPRLVDIIRTKLSLANGS